MLNESVPVPVTAPIEIPVTTGADDVRPAPFVPVAATDHIAARDIAPHPGEGRGLVTGCGKCALTKGQGGPPHDPSARCVSGQHAHCTCDTCF